MGTIGEQNSRLFGHKARKRLITQETGRENQLLPFSFFFFYLVHDQTLVLG